METSSGKTAEKLDVKPLMLCGKVVTNGLGNVVMNDRWIYVNGTAINVWRAHFCEKERLKNVTIQDAIGANKLMDADLKKFVENVSDKVVFTKYGKTYRIFLEKKTNRTYGIRKIQLYNWTIAQNRKFDGVFAYQLSIDWKSKFYIN